MSNRGRRGLIGHLTILAFVAVWAGTGLLGASSATAGTIEWVGIFADGIGLGDVGRAPSVSADGRYVAIWQDSNIVIHDRATGTTETVSEVNVSFSLWPSVSADGRYVAFASISTLVSVDTFDVFVRDRLTGTTERVSVDSAGGEGNSDSGDSGVSISADGRYVAFASSASNLVPGDTNGRMDVFVHDRASRTTERVSVDSRGDQANRPSFFPSLSADGRYVAFVTNATNLVSGDTNGKRDVFVHDRATGTTERVSVDSAGGEGYFGSGEPSLSADGRYVAFDSWVALVPGDTNGESDVFVRDRLAGTTERVSVSSTADQGNGYSGHPSISGDGRYVVFESGAANLVPGDTNGVPDVFVRDRLAGTTERVSVDSAGAEGNRESVSPGISADGGHVAFVSLADNLVTYQPYDFGEDVFVHSFDE